MKKNEKKYLGNLSYGKSWYFATASDWKTDFVSSFFVLGYFLIVLFYNWVYLEQNNQKIS